MLTPQNQNPTVAPTPSTQPQQPPIIVSKKKFHNGWTSEIEKLMADWADKAITYRWMHERTERKFATKDKALMFPIIILSTITGAANFALDSAVSDPEYKKYAQLGLGGLSILTGIITTFANRQAYASRSEAHKIAGIHWGKFQRLIAIELSLHPDERSDCMAFLKMCRNELDRLIEQAPTIPQEVIDDCRREFKKYPKVHVPEMVGNIDTTRIYVDSNSRLKRLAEEAALTLQHRKGVLKQIILDDLEPRIQRIIDISKMPELKEEARRIATTAVKEALRVAPAEISQKMIAYSAQTAAKQELKELELSGVVQSMKHKLQEAHIGGGGPPPKGIGALFANIKQQQQSQSQFPSVPSVPSVGSSVSIVINTEQDKDKQSSTNISDRIIIEDNEDSEDDEITKPSETAPITFVEM